MNFRERIEQQRLDRLRLGEMWRENKELAAAFYQRNPTKAEDVLGNCIRQFGFEQQVVLYGYIVDFYHRGLRLALEVDGEVHFSSESRKRDRERDQNLRYRGVGVLRVTNADVLNEIGRTVALIRRVIEALEHGGA